jgi:peptidoglycan-associated lipoprotein
MKNIIPYFVGLAVILFVNVGSAHAQFSLVEADKAFEQFNFEKAINLYEQAYRKKQTLHAAERLATSYHLQSNYKQTESWAALAAGMEKAKPEHVLSYAKALQNNAKYREAKIQYEKYASLKPDLSPSQKSLWLQSCDSAIKWMQNPRNFVLKNEKELNSPQSDWGAFPQNNSIVFASDRGFDGYEDQVSGKPFLRFDATKGPNKGIYSWTGNHYLRIFIKRDTGSVEKYPISAGTDYHVGPATFTEANDEAFFTITRIPKNLKFDYSSVLKQRLATTRVEVFSLTKDLSTGIWSKEPIAFKFNNPTAYSITDPFISADGKSLYFASNMQGGKGGLDIYVSHRDANNEWGTPVNLTDINTENDERSPSIGKNGKFYFSTDGLVGMGGLDVFRAQINGDRISNPENLNYPLNSPQDDFAFLLLAENEGYMASNRFGGLGSDDIYSFIEQAAINYVLTGTAYNKVTKEPLADAIVTLTKNGEAGTQVHTDSEGKYKFNLERESAYAITGEKTNFRSDAADLTTVGLGNTSDIKKDLFLEPIIINKAIKLENIYYDFDKANIRNDAAIELDKLVKIMKDNPTIWIELGSHTDSRGNDNYNQQLSQRRANSAVQYIIDRGIDRNRIVAIGYGEKQLLNRCTNGIKCTADEHQLNRRTEFKITKQ